MTTRPAPLLIVLFALAVASAAPTAAQNAPKSTAQSSTGPQSTVEFAQSFSLGLLAAPVTLPGDRFTGILDLGLGADGADGSDAGILQGIFFNAGNGGSGATGGHLATTVGFGPFSIFTVGQVGIRSSSTGGDGGDGGHNNTIFEAGGGDGGRGGNGGSVIVTTTSTTGGIVTIGNGAAGILASSRGGNGGNGGDGSALFVGIGGQGNYGGNGGTVAVDANNAISTAGSSAHGIIGQSFGGNGGDGGDGTGLVSGGGDGSASGNAGRVDVTSSGNIVTTGGRAFGIFSQSVGGFSGSGGAGIGYVTFGGGATSGGNGSIATITNTGSVTTHGSGSHALFAQSVGGNGGASGLGVGVVAIGGSGSDGGRASTARIDNTGNVITTGPGARGIFAQSVGGGGGDGGVSVGIVAFGGRGAAGGNGGQVVVTNTGALVTSSDGIVAQSVGGGGGSGGGTVGTTISMGATGSAGGNGGSVGVTNDGQISTTQAGSRGIFAQSVGGGGGDGSFSGGLVAIGGRGGTASHGGAVSVANNGLIASRSHAVFAQSVGGGGGSGGLSGGWFSFGGAGGAGGNASTVNVQNTGGLGTTDEDSSALVAQSIGGGGGSGGGSVSVGAFISVGVGGSGGDGGDGRQVDVTSTAPLIATLGARSHGVYAQSVGGGGGNGGFAASASIGYIVSASFGKGGTGALGGTGGVVNTTIGGNITTLGSDAVGVFAQSVGGGGGSGGWTISASGSDTVSVGLGFGGTAGGGGAASAVLLETTGGHIATAGVRSHGLFAQSVGGGGGSGGFSIAGGFSGVGAGALSMGGSGGAGGAGAAVTVDNQHAITTTGHGALGLFAQSVGGGGGAAGFSVAAGGSGTAAGTIALGASGGSGGNSGIVTVTSAGALNTFGEKAVGLFAQSVGGGGGRGGFSASGAGAGTGAVTFNLGGSGGGGGDAEAVLVDSHSAITTRGLEAHGLFAQSLGGGGGNGGFSLSGSGAGTGSGTVGIGGFGGGGGIGRSVDVTSRGLVETFGESAFGLFAQSVGGGGGTGGFSLTGTGAGTGAGTFNLGGKGGGGGASDRVAVVSEGGIITHGDDSTGLFAQSIGGGGGNGGFSLTGSGAGTGSGTIGIGGFGGSGGTSGIVDVTNRGLVDTSGAGSIGILAQSVGGGGGSGRFSISGSGAGTGSGSFNLGGAGGGGGNADRVWAVSDGAIVTRGDDATGLFAQSVGGGGGNGGFSITGSGAGTGSGSIGIGGFGGDGGNGREVDVTTLGSITTIGDGAVGLLAQSIGGGGGNGRFSIVGSGAKSGSGTFSLGGGGGLGGVGDAVTINNDATITTAGVLSYGIFGQSVGGGGGSGGFSFSGGVTTTGGQLNSSVGGSGGSGGNAGTVALVNSAAIATAGGGTHAVLVQSLGGGGGAGGFSGSISATGSSKPNVAVAIGGWGGIGGDGAAVTLDNLASEAILTQGFAASGLFAQSVGGGGGDGGGSLAVAFGVHPGSGNLAVGVGGALGGTGGAAGDGGIVDVDNGAAITTLDARSHGIFAQSVGGGGGTGGFSATGVLGRGTATKDLSVSIGGAGGAGGIGSAVDVYNTGAIAVRGGSASGIFAQSLGGGGGDGGFSFAGSFGTGGVKDAEVTVGGAGGDGNSGGAVTVVNHGAIDIAADMTPEVVRAAVAALPIPLTPEQEAALVDALYTARPAPGIVAQSIGGGGGNGGDSFALDLANLGAKKSWDMSAAVSVGGAGGSGNAGGLVDVTNHAAVITRDDDSDGLFLQSIGGGGGRGGSSRTGGATLAASDGNSLRINVAVGGAGGDGNIAGAVEATNSGSILTLGDMSAGIRAQSIGGGGGLGGSAGGGTFTFDVSFLNDADPGDELGLQVSVGGHGGTGNDGGTVHIDNSGSIVTRGTVSHGLFAQSIGAGGGSGGDSLDGLGIKGEKILDLADKATGFLSSRKDPIAEKVKDKLKDIVSEWNVAVGGNAGSSGDGAAVTVDNTATVTTSGYGSNAIFAQSVGGGGGEGVGTVSGETAGGKAEAGALGKVGIGGAGGAAGDGGAVAVTTSGLLTTAGDSAYGILAQSIGGGGGVAGNVERALAEETTIPIVGVTIPALNIGLGVDFGRDGGGAGDGGVVTVTNTGDIVTTGSNSSGIFAQSIGGGGGLAGGIGLLSQAASAAGPYNFAGSVGGDGSGGTVTVTQVGTISTAGTAADGVFAQSAGGKDLGGDVTVDLTGSIFATGAGSNGILAQSRGDLGTGNITITLRDGTVAGGAGGAAISVVEGATNLIENFGAITTTQGIAGMAVLGTTGDETVRNAGTLIGSIDLGDGANSLTNMAGARFDAGATIDLGADRLFTNSGLFSPGGAGLFQNTTLTGNLTQAGAPSWLVDLGEIGVSDSLAVAGSSLGGDVTTLDLNMMAVPEDIGAYTILSAEGGLSGSGFQFGTLFGPVPIGRTFDLSRTETTMQVTLQPSSGAFYWDGAASSTWSSPFVDGRSNWTRASAGDFIFGTPGAASDVIFMPTGSVTALGAHFTVNSLTFAGAEPSSTHATGIAAGHTLTLGGGRGITVAPDSPGAHIAVDLVLGVDQLWTNGSELAVSGATITGAGRHLTIAGSGVTIIGAAIETGSGSLTKEGDGTLVLTGENQYRGGTTVSGGVLVGTTTSVQGNILNDAVVAFDQAADGTYAGVMSGSGSLFKLNGGVLTLSGAHSYSGGTWVAEGTLLGNTRSLQGTIQNDAAVIFDQTAPGSYAGSMIGTGVLTKLGEGTLRLTGNSRTFAGETILGAGSLVVDGWLGGSSVLAQPGTRLGGSGILPSTTILGGATLTPGNSIGTLGVMGNVRFGEGSTYSIETHPDGSSDVTVATGSLAIEGGAVNVFAGGADYAPITRYPIFSAAGGISGTFTGLTADLPFLTPTLDYETNLLLLTLRRNDVDFSIDTPNGSARQVARVLNELVPTATGAMADVINHLYALPEPDSLRSIRSLGGGIYQQVAMATLGGVRTFTDMNLSRLGRSEPSAAADPEPARQSYRRSASATARVTDWLGAERASGWWVRGLAGDARLPDEGTDPGATVPTRGIVIGFDRAVTPRLALGVSGARTDPEVRQEGSFDYTTSRMLHAGVYGTYRFGASRVSASAGAGNQRYRTRREIFAGEDPSFAAADYDGRSYFGQVEFRHGVRLGGGVSVEAELGLQAAALTFDPVTEDGAGVVGLMLPRRRIESQRSLLGGTVYKAFGAGPRPGLTLEGRAAWAHVFDARGAMATRFLGDTQSGGFQIPAAGQRRDSALLGASIYSGVWERVRLFADVTSEVGGSMTTIAGSAGVGWKW